MNCLRCKSNLVLGKIQHQEQLYPLVWSIGTHEEPRGKIRLLGKSEAETQRKLREQFLQSRTYVDAYRCPDCGHVELCATRKVAAE